MFARAHTCPHCASRLPKAAARCLVCGALTRGAGRAWAAPLSLPGQELPRISVTTHDYSRLGDMARRHLRSGRAATWFLIAELERAALCHPKEIPANVATMNSRVLFQVGADGEVEAGMLAYPDQHVPGQRPVPVLTPLGTALLGLREGDRMPFEDWRGRKRSVVLRKVAFQPEAG